MVPAASVGVPDRFMVLVRYKIPTSYLRLTTLLLRQSGRFFLEFENCALFSFLSSLILF